MAEPLIPTTAPPEAPGDNTSGPQADSGGAPEAWNALPNTALDCTYIGLDHQTEVESVDTRPVNGDSLTFVVRSCLVGTGGASRVIEVYKGSRVSAPLVGILLAQTDNAGTPDVEVNGDRITVRASMRLPDDPGCCSSGQLTREYRYADGRVKEIT